MLDLSERRTYIMGILNLTPDSFSGDGIYKDVDRAVAEAERLVEEGADIIDVGGESTRPGALPVDTEEEIARVVTVIDRITKKLKIPVSIDTRKSEVAAAALEHGAGIINDITGMEYDDNMAEIAARHKAFCVLMHIKGDPQNMQKNPVYSNLLEEIYEKLRRLVERAEDRGVKPERIIIDPGIGFGKTFEHNLEILRNLSFFRRLGKPILVGPSRKSFIGNILGVPPGERIFGTAAAVSIAIQNGASIVRVHDVKEMKQVAMVTDAILKRQEEVYA